MTPPLTLTASTPALAAARVARALRAPGPAHERDGLAALQLAHPLAELSKRDVARAVDAAAAQLGGLANVDDVSRPLRTPSATSAGDIERVLENNIGGGSYSIARRPVPARSRSGASSMCAWAGSGFLGSMSGIGSGVAEADVGQDAVQRLGQPPGPAAEQTQEHRH
jgi:hypothetical protein